jgi:hypothetical protein
MTLEQITGFGWNMWQQWQHFARNQRSRCEGGAGRALHGLAKFILLA